MQSGGEHRPEPPMAAPPVQMVEAFLGFLRATLLWKLEGLTEEQCRLPLTPSGVCLLGIVKHSAYVERFWFQRNFAGIDIPSGWSTGDPDADWRIEPDETKDGLIAFYRAEVEKSRAIVATATWDDICKWETSQNLGRSLGWVLTHMVEEVARHCGHADILREMIDGATGE